VIEIEAPFDPKAAPMPAAATPMRRMTMRRTIMATIITMTSMAIHDHHHGHSHAHDHK